MRPEPLPPTPDGWMGHLGGPPARELRPGGGSCCPLAASPLAPCCVRPPIRPALGPRCQEPSAALTLRSSLTPVLRPQEVRSQARPPSFLPPAVKPAGLVLASCPPRVTVWGRGCPGRGVTDPGPPGGLCRPLPRARAALQQRRVCPCLFSPMGPSPGSALARGRRPAGRSQLPWLRVSRSRVGFWGFRLLPGTRSLGLQAFCAECRALRLSALVPRGHGPFFSSPRSPLRSEARTCWNLF